MRLKLARVLALLLAPLWRLALTPDLRPRSDPALHVVLAADRLLYRLTGGAHHRDGGRSILLLTTCGRRSGRLRSLLLVYLRDGDGLVVVASNAGRERPPAWLLNLEAEPQAEVQVDGRRLRVHGRVAGPAERGRLWPRVVALSARFDAFQRGLQREIALVVLQPLP